MQVWIAQGGWSPDFGPPGSASDPDGALLEFVDGNLFALPAEGYVAEGRDEDRRLYTNSVDREAKVAVIVVDGAHAPAGVEEGWVVETFASCDPAEYDTAADNQIPKDIWQDADGNRVPTSIVTSSQVLSIVTGSQSRSSGSKTADSWATRIEKPDSKLAAFGPATGSTQATRATPTLKIKL